MCDCDDFGNLCDFHRELYVGEMCSECEHFFSREELPLHSRVHDLKNQSTMTQKAISYLQKRFKVDGYGISHQDAATYYLKWVANR